MINGDISLPAARRPRPELQVARDPPRTLPGCATVLCSLVPACPETGRWSCLGQSPNAQLLLLLLPALRVCSGERKPGQGGLHPAGRFSAPGSQQPGSPCSTSGQSCKACTSLLHSYAYPKSQCMSSLHPNACLTSQCMSPCIPMYILLQPNTHPPTSQCMLSLHPTARSHCIPLHILTASHPLASQCASSCISMHIFTISY